MKSLKPYLKRIALDLGILGGSQKYVKFIILTRSRTGSEYLRSLLNSHRQITVFGELFKNQDFPNWDFPGFYRPRKQRTLLQQDPVLLLKKEIFRTYPKKMKAVGFKIFYYHAQNDSWRTVWTYLQAQRDLKILHLKRKNVLKTHLSRKRADSSGKWINLTGEKEDDEPMILNYEECLEVFKKTREWENKYDTFFSDHDKLNIYYENLCDDNRGELCRIQKFLGVKEEELKPKTYKQVTEPLAKVIANYHELKEQFDKTVWAEFFEE